MHLCGVLVCVCLLVSTIFSRLIQVHLFRNIACRMKVQHVNSRHIRVNWLLCSFLFGCEWMLSIAVSPSSKCLSVTWKRHVENFIVFFPSSGVTSVTFWGPRGHTSMWGMNSVVFSGCTWWKYWGCTFWWLLSIPKPKITIIFTKYCF